MAVRAAIGGFIVLALQGCAGEQFSLGSSTRPPTDDALPGRWLLTTPNARLADWNLAARLGRATERLRPMAGDFYTSRRWAMEGGTLTIANERNEPLAQFKFAGNQFEGRSAAGTPVILAR
ncbi:MAG: hypothetical protein WCD62_19455 [Pseudolabrys sp.]